MPQTNRQTTRQRKPVNLLVRIDLLQRARGLGVNLSSLLEWTLERELVERERLAWLESNAAAIAAYNESVARDGLFKPSQLR